MNANSIRFAVVEWAWLRGYNPWPELPAYAALVA